MEHTHQQLTFFLVDQLLGYTLDRGQPVSKIITEYTVIIITLGITNVSMLCLKSKPDKGEYFSCGLLFMVLVCFISYNPIRLARLAAALPVPKIAATCLLAIAKQNKPFP